MRQPKNTTMPKAAAILEKVDHFALDDNSTCDTKTYTEQIAILSEGTAQRCALLAGGRDEIKLREQDSVWV